VSPPDTTLPGWEIRQGQAVWQPRPEAPELAGELVLMTNPDGHFVLEFSKTPLSLVRAHRSENGWQLEIPAEQRRWSGTGRPTTRLLWLHLADALRGTPLPNGLEFHGSVGNWGLTNTRTGERLEGYLSR
jgi:hypothetical protein